MDYDCDKSKAEDERQPYIINPRYEAMAYAGDGGDDRDDFGIEPEHDRGDWLVVSDGSGTYGRFYPLDPSPDEVNLDWVLYHLSNLCRYTGATNRFYSVLEHSFYVGDMVLAATHDPVAALCGYLHDATEAVVGDLNRPTKHYCPDYRAIESDVWDRAMVPAFNLPSIMPGSVKTADRRMALTEKRDLLPGSPPWKNTRYLKPYAELDLTYDQFDRTSAGLIPRMKSRIRWCQQAAKRV